MFYFLFELYICVSFYHVAHLVIGNVVMLLQKCSHCQRIHCSKCSHRFLSAKVCAFCFRLLSLSFNRQDLDQYTIKELRHFLIRCNRCTDSFKERADLVEAVMKLKCPQNQASDDAEHVRHVQQLKV